MSKLLNNLAQVINQEQLEIPKTSVSESRVTDGLQLLFGIFAAVAVLMIAISALRMVLSRGNSQDIQKARDSVIYAAVGLALSLSALAIVTFVVERV